MTITTSILKRNLIPYVIYRANRIATNYMTNMKDNNLTADKRGLAKSGFSV